MTRQRIVLTRQAEQAGDLEAGLRAAGWDVALLPLTDFELPADPAELVAALERLRGGHYAWLVLTSPNAVRVLGRAGWDGGLPASTRAAVTGPGTARVLADAGGPSHPWMPAADHSAAGIAHGFPAGPGAGGGRDRVLLPQSDLASNVVAEGLSDSGWAVDRVEAYRTVPYPADPARRLLSGAGPGGGEDVNAEEAGTEGPGAVVGLEDLAGAAVVLTSPSAVRELVRRGGEGELVGLPGHRGRQGLPGHRGRQGLPGHRGLLGLTLVAIGAPTAREAERLGLDLEGTAPTPDAAGILTVLGALGTPRRP